MLSILATALKSTALLATASALGQLKWIWYTGTPRPLRDFQTFDYASRGPFGGLLLLSNPPGSALAFMGAIIMIMALGLDAAIQASTSQQLRSQFTPGAASVPVTRNWKGSAIADPTLQSALNEGILNYEISYWTTAENHTYDELGFMPSNGTITPLCGTGNCTFDLYPTLAVQHQCQDMASSLIYSPENNSTHQEATLSATTMPLLSPDRDAVYLNISMLTTDMEPDKDWKQITTSTNGTYWEVYWDDIDTIFPGVNTSFLDSYDPLSSYTPGRLPFAELFLIYVNNSNLNDDHNSTGNFVALRCNLDFGMQTYTSSVENGNFIETPQHFFSDGWTMDTHGSPNRSEWQWVLSQNISGRAYGVSVNVSGWVSNLPSAGKFQEDGYEDAGGLEMYRALKRAHNNTAAPVDALFGHVARSASAYFRSALADRAPGTAESRQQYIDVQWGWLLVPLAFVALNTAFVLAVRLQSARLGVPGWKNSALALAAAAGEVADAGAARSRVMWVGPPPGTIDCVSELAAWARTKDACLRDRGPLVTETKSWISRTVYAKLGARTKNPETISLEPLSRTDRS